MKFHLQAATLSVWIVCSMLSVAFGDLEPIIPPGYTPEDAKTEQGIWMELKDYERAIQRSALLIKDEELSDYVEEVACRVTGDYCPDLRVYVIRNPNFNASMTANGVMVVWTGLLVRVSSEDELAAVLGHELAHYTQLHTLDRLKQIKKSMAAGSIFDLGLIFLTGASVPVGQLAAIANLMAFSRDQEEEADLLGAKFMAQSGYDPHAAAQVWEMIIEEEESAAVKRRKPGVFSKTHPSSAGRIVALKKFVSENYSQLEPEPAGNKRHVEMLNHHYMQLMEDQIDTNRFGRTEAILSKHQEIGVDQNLVSFFQGEMFRQRNEDGDAKSAENAYMRAVEGSKPIADAYLNLAYMYLKEERLSEAKYNFSQYLALKPDTDDREMIEFYIQEIQP
jgi:predicted Zn-dependent protease